MTTNPDHLQELLDLLTKPLDDEIDRLTRRLENLEANFRALQDMIQREPPAPIPPPRYPLAQQPLSPL